MANQQLKNVKAQTKAKSITTIDCNQNRGCVFVNFINKCCLPISFLIVYQMLLYILANIVNQATTTNGYWQIFVVIPAIDKALPDLTNQLAMAIIMDIIYIYIYTINYLLIPIYFYWINKKIFYRYLFFATISYTIAFVFILFFPCYNYLHDPNWVAYTKGPTAMDDWCAFPSYHISIIFIMNIFAYIIWRNTTNRKKIATCVLIYSTIYVVLTFLTIMFNKQHYFLDGIGSIGLNLFLCYIDYKTSLTLKINKFYLLKYNRHPLTYLVIFYSIFSIMFVLLMVSFSIWYL